MVLESLFSGVDLEQSPWRIGVLSVLIVSVGVLATQYVAKSLSGDAASIMLIALVALPSMSEILKLFEKAEFDEERSPFLGSRTLGRHYPILVILLTYFVALVLAFTVWFVVLPPAQSTHLFNAQITELTYVQASVTGNAVQAGLQAKAVQKFQDTFQLVFFHNLEVLALILIFSAVYGAGAVLILAWNASVIGVFLGQLALKAPAQGGANAVIGTILGGILGLAPHGTFELLSYSAGALAGGILSASIIHQAYKRGGLFVLIIRDITKLLVWAILFLGLGAAIESGAIAF